MSELEHLNSLYHAWRDAADTATHAQHDIILFMQHHLHGNQEAPPASMQQAADELWRRATHLQAALSEYFSAHLR